MASATTLPVALVLSWTTAQGRTIQCKGVKWHTEMEIWRFGLENRKQKMFGRMNVGRVIEWCTGDYGRTEVKNNREK